MTLDELRAKLPPDKSGLVDLYGPTLVAMTIEQLLQWLEYVYLGLEVDAYNLYLRNARPQDAPSILDQLDAEWAEANEANAARIALHKRIAQGVAQAMAPIILAVVGF